MNILPCYDQDGISLYLGDCLEVISTFPDNSVDSVVTDPPYGLEFMGKDWDKLGAGTEAAVREGTDKSHPFRDGSKRVRYGTSVTTMQEWHRKWVVEALRVLKPGAHLLAFGGTRTNHRLVCALEDAGWEIRDTIMYITGQGFPKSLNLPGGFGTGLKPSYEPIVLARKPLEGTVAQNVQQYGTGALNIDATRIGTTKNVPASPSRHVDIRTHGKYGAEDGTASGFDANVGRWPANLILECICDDGEYNVHSNPDCPCAMLDKQSGSVGNNWKRNYGEKDYKGRQYGGGSFGGGGYQGNSTYADFGGASRFFYHAKASTKERNFGLDDLPSRSPGELTSRKDGAAGTSNPRAGAGRDTGSGVKKKNTHPTVKSLKLMQYLVRLVTPLNGIVLDPFMGSGTTGIAAKLEGMRFVGIEKEEEYMEIAKLRIAAYGRKE